MNDSGIDLIKFAGDHEFLREDEHKTFSELRRRTTSIAEMFGTRLSNVSSLHSYAEDTYDDLIVADPNAVEDDGEYRDSSSRKDGGTSAKIYWVYLRSGAGIIMLPILLLSNIVTQVVFTGSDYWLSQWTSYQENQVLAKETNHTVWKSWMVTEDQNTNIIIYSCLVAFLFVFSIVRTVAFFTTCMRASVKLHNRLLKAVIRAPIAFFDKYPIGMILNRVSRDLGIKSINLYH